MYQLYASLVEVPFGKRACNDAKLLVPITTIKYIESGLELWDEQI